MFSLIKKYFQLTKSFLDNQRDESLKNTFLKNSFTKTYAPNSERDVRAGAIVCWIHGSFNPTAMAAASVDAEIEP